MTALSASEEILLCLAYMYARNGQRQRKASEHRSVCGGGQCKRSLTSPIAFVLCAKQKTIRNKHNIYIIYLKLQSKTNHSATFAAYLRSASIMVVLRREPDSVCAYRTYTYRYVLGAIRGNLHFFAHNLKSCSRKAYRPQ